MQTKFIKGLNQLQGKYDTFFIDLWGVIHNGIQVYPGAIDVLENLNKLNKRFVLMSNAPRPSKNVQDFLLKLNIDKSLIKNVFTSGEAALESLKQNKFGKNFYHLGPKTIILQSWMAISIREACHPKRSPWSLTEHPSL